MGEPLLNFPRTVIDSTSTTYSNSALPQLLNLGLSINYIALKKISPMVGSHPIETQPCGQPQPGRSDGLRGLPRL